MKTTRKRAGAMLVLALVLAVTTIFGSTVSASAAAKATTIKSSSITVTVGQTKTISLSNKKSGATYAFTSSKKSVATVSKKGVVKGVKAGTATITVKQTYKKKTTIVGKVAVTVKPLTLKGSCTLDVDSYDTGALVNRAVVKLDKAVDSINASDLEVYETKMEMNYETFQMAEMRADRVVTKAYLCDATGREVKTPSKYIAIDLKPTADCKHIFGAAGAQNLNVWSTTYKLNIALAKGAAVTSNGSKVSAISLDAECTYMNLSDAVNKFDTITYKAKDGVEYKCATYTPEQKADTLVVWLHGLGEGGTADTDPRVILLAAEATALAKDEFQNKIGGAYILAPQCPTWWMDPSGKGVELDGSTTGSYYANSLDELIDAYAAQVGAKKIVLAGCSNGGYMTMVMALKNPTKYTAIVPICEALEYSESLNPKLDAIKDLPMYFVYSEDDPLVVPQSYEIPTIAYLTKIGATNLHVSVTDHVYAYFEGMSPAYQFGHASWIYFFNNQTKDASGVSAWDWLASELKK